MNSNKTKKHKTELSTPLFSILSSQVNNYKFYKIISNNWVNVIPITKDKKVVLVKQHRFGIDKTTLEIPGGLIDDKDKSPRAAAKRELLEETGYGNGKLKTLGWAHPNPAIQSNKCYFFLMTEVEKIKGIKNDENESTSVVLVPLKNIPNLIKNNTITHALVIAAFQFYDYN